MIFRRFLCSILMLFACMLSADLFAQEAEVYGLVRDAQNRPAFGVSVAVFGKPIGTTTDGKGKFSLKVPANQSLKIFFSFTGLQSDSVLLELSPGERKEGKCKSKQAKIYFNRKEKFGTNVESAQQNS